MTGPRIDPLRAQYERERARYEYEREKALYEQSQRRAVAPRPSAPAPEPEPEGFGATMAKVGRDIKKDPWGAAKSIGKGLAVNAVDLLNTTTNPLGAPAYWKKVRDEEGGDTKKLVARGVGAASIVVPPLRYGGKLASAALNRAANAGLGAAQTPDAPLVGGALGLLVPDAAKLAGKVVAAPFKVAKRVIGDARVARQGEAAIEEMLGSLKAEPGGIARRKGPATVQAELDAKVDAGDVRTMHSGAPKLYGDTPRPAASSLRPGALSVKARLAERSVARRSADDVAQHGAEKAAAEAAAADAARNTLESEAIQIEAARNAMSSHEANVANFRMSEADAGDVRAWHSGAPKLSSDILRPAAQSVKERLARKSVTRRPADDAAAIAAQRLAEQEASAARRIAETAADADAVTVRTPDGPTAPASPSQFPDGYRTQMDGAVPIRAATPQFDRPAKVHRPQREVLSAADVRARGIEKELTARYEKLSNHRAIVGAWEDHPLHELLDAESTGVNVGKNLDPSLSHGELRRLGAFSYSEEQIRLIEEMGLSVHDVQKMGLQARLAKLAIVKQEEAIARLTAELPQPMAPHADAPPPARPGIEALSDEVLDRNAADAGGGDTDFDFGANAAADVPPVVPNPATIVPNAAPAPVAPPAADIAPVPPPANVAQNVAQDAVPVPPNVAQDAPIVPQAPPVVPEAPPIVTPALERAPMAPTVDAPAAEPYTDFEKWFHPDGAGAKSAVQRLKETVAKDVDGFNASRGYESMETTLQKSMELARQMTDDNGLNTLDANGIAALVRAHGPAAIPAVRQVVKENMNVVAAASRVKNDPNASTAMLEEAGRVIDTAMAQTDDLLHGIVKEQANSGRTVNAFKLISRLSTDPDVWLVHAKRIMGDKPMTADIQARVTMLAREAASACDL